MKTLSLCTSVIVFSLTFTSTHAQENNFEGEVQPADVMLVVQDIAGDIEAIRSFMGKPELTLNRLHVDFATPKHVFYQSQTMFRKVNRLASEVAGVTRQSPPPAPEVNQQVLPRDVMRMVTLVKKQVDLISTELGVTSDNEPGRRNPRLGPADVFEEVVHINRQVNLMIDEPFRPSDVFEQLSLVSAYLAGNLASLGQAPYPEINFVPDKQPLDVYSVLIDLLFLNQEIGEKLDVQVLRLNSRRLKREFSFLSDNYDLATLLLSDAATWTEKLATDEDIFPLNDQLKHIFPSHVFAKASMVREQLQQINEYLDNGVRQEISAR